MCEVLRGRCRHRCFLLARAGNLIAGALSTEDGAFQRNLWFLNVLLAMVGAGLVALTARVKFFSKMELYNEKE